jgi:hypothetical protein
VPTTPRSLAPVFIDTGRAATLEAQGAGPVVRLSLSPKALLIEDAVGSE